MSKLVQVLCTGIVACALACSSSSSDGGGSPAAGGEGGAQNGAAGASSPGSGVACLLSAGYQCVLYVPANAPKTGCSAGPCPPSTMKGSVSGCCQLPPSSGMYDVCYYGETAAGLTDDQNNCSQIGGTWSATP